MRRPARTFVCICDHNREKIGERKGGRRGGGQLSLELLDAMGVLAKSLNPEETKKEKRRENYFPYF